MRQIVFGLPVVLSALVVAGACAPSNEAPNTGGHVVPSNGGSGATGGTGATAGSTSSGGAAATGGTSGAAGSTVGGASGTGGDGNISGSGGSSGSAGSGGGTGGPKPSAGCGKPAIQELGNYVAHTVAITGATLGEPDTHMSREIWVRLPANYDPNTPYRVVYQTVGCGASGTSGYPLWEEGQGGDPNAIYVGLSRPDPPPDPPSMSTCYDNRGGVDSIEWESLEKDHYFVRDNFCVDENKVYTGGYSSGGWMSNMYGCYFGGIDPARVFMPDVALRGALAVAGCWIDGNPPCSTQPVARIWVHDELDMAPNAYSCATEQRDRSLGQNGCTGGADGPTEVWEVPDGECVKYTACPAEYPVIFCTTQGRGHGASNDIAIPEFTKMMQEIEALTP